MFKKYFPILVWIKHYTYNDFASDTVAAIVVTIMLIPQSLAYALLAGLPPQIGLYASIIPLLIYSIFGTSNTLAVGPVAVIALMTFAVCSKFAQPGSSEFVSIRGRQWIFLPFEVIKKKKETIFAKSTLLHA